MFISHRFDYGRAFWDVKSKKDCFCMCGSPNCKYSAEVYNGDAENWWCHNAINDDVFVPSSVHSLAWDIYQIFILSNYYFYCIFVEKNIHKNELFFNSTVHSNYFLILLYNLFVLVLKTFSNICLNSWDVRIIIDKILSTLIRLCLLTIFRFL